MNSHWYTPTAKNMFQLYFGLGSPASPSAFYLALSANSADPAQTWTELGVENYSRQQISFSYGGDVYMLNSSQLSFSNLGQGQVVGQRIYDASTGGNLLFWSDLDTVITFATGHTITYPSGIIRVGLSL